LEALCSVGRLATDPEKELPDTFAIICRVLLLKCNNREQHVADKDDIADWIFDRVELTEKSVASLKEICRRNHSQSQELRQGSSNEFYYRMGHNRIGVNMQEQFYNCF
jgi:hypothetical protein